jgi:hypothetical protein
MNSRILSAILLGFAFGGAAVRADTIGVANSENCYPFTCNDSGIGTGQSIEYQQVYSKTAFSGPIAITWLTFFNSFAESHGFAGGPVLTGNYDISFSVTSAPVNGLSSTLTNNIGTSLVTFFNGSLGGPVPGNTFTITGTPFAYNPANGNLLMDVVVTNQPNVPNTGSNGYFDLDNTGSKTSRAFSVTNQTPSSDSAGLVTGFNTITPEPSSALLICGGVLAMIIRRKSRSRQR